MLEEILHHLPSNILGLLQIFVIHETFYTLSVDEILKDFVDEVCGDVHEALFNRRERVSAEGYLH